MKIFKVGMRDSDRRCGRDWDRDWGRNWGAGRAVGGDGEVWKESEGCGLTVCF